MNINIIRIIDAKHHSSFVPLDKARFLKIFPKILDRICKLLLSRSIYYLTLFSIHSKEETHYNV